MNIFRTCNSESCNSASNVGKNSFGGGSCFMSTIIKVILVIVFIKILILINIAIFEKIKSDKEIPKISINGYGEVEVIPDIAIINFTLREINNSTDKDKNIELQNKISKTIDSLYAGFKDLKIEEKDIKTESYNVRPKYSYKNCFNVKTYCEPNYISGYEISKSVSIKVRDTKNIDKILSLLSSNQVTEVNGPNFTIDDIEKLKDEARDKAIKNAKEKAKSLSKSLDVKIEKIISYEENVNNIIPYQVRAQGMKAMSIASNVVAEDINVFEGTQKVSSNITIVFEIED